MASTIRKERHDAYKAACRAAKLEEHEELCQAYDRGEFMQWQDFLVIAFLSLLFVGGVFALLPYLS
jgi:hypothetical protein